ncbi:hydantoinase B/oxoprolinase family protein [Pseudomaricurvus alkylphenolicus]|uniref:hydantoinase B/oxoprolinase family protein n=1 Tax=Pseudomaricurvus alkylphenolicus TaxID=1306991 RepID=UPI001421D987|nr:hydantoinase B/oxoprolinase family protein [Pseudomaricurvus alkylphenolicus]NIB42172.1 hydantoinase B/oxoprolinase family protein [Pseudomaricurvus alkylphenolicus]
MPAIEQDNPYTLEIIKSSLIAIGDEMFAAMSRTSMSPIIYEALDYSVGVTDAKGDLIAQGNGTTVFLGMIDSLVEDILAKFQGNIYEGDVFVGNDPYSGGGTHLCDVAIAKPVFFNDQLVAFTVNKAHWVDVGGMSPGSFTTNASEIFQEGIQLPTVKIFEKGDALDSVIDILKANIRMPESSMGDFWAGMAANNVGEGRLHDLFSKYGEHTVKRAMDELLEYGETMIAAEIRKLPKGSFYAEDWIDDDGLGDEPLKVCVKIDITEDKFVADFSGSAPQALGPINTSRSGLVSAVRTIFKAMTNPKIPANGGCFRALEVICPEETVFSAKRPAPVSTYWETMLYAEDLIWKALAEHIPERLSAGHLLSVCAFILSGTHPATGEPTILVGPLVGGWGAMKDRDGLNGQFSIADGETYNFPVEITEARYGVKVNQYAFHNEDGGFGRYQGGKGNYLEYEVCCEEAFFTGSFGRFKFPPWGVDGGLQGSSNYVEILRGGQPCDPPEIYGKAARVPLKKGDVVRMVTATGGGWGDPSLRSPQAVAEDLKNGYITSEQAQRVYGR